MFVTYPDVRYLSGCDDIRGASAPFSPTSPHLGLLLSGVTPLSAVFRAPSGHVAAFKASSPISHVIPLRLLQTLYLHRWNCNVLSDARKMTVGNYVRLFRQSPVVPSWPPAGRAGCAGPAAASRVPPGRRRSPPRATASYRTLHAAQEGHSMQISPMT